MIHKRFKAIAVLIFLLGLSLLAEALIERSPHFAWDGFGFFAWFGFLSCAILIVFAKLLAFFIHRPDTYYDDD